MSSAPWLLSAAAAGQPSRSASCATAKPRRGFQVFRIDGYSWTKTLLGGERITSEEFTIGGHDMYVDYYPNGTDKAKDESDSISLYLRLDTDDDKQRMRADYKFSLLDLAGNAAYELPVKTGIFKSIGHNGGDGVEDLGCGYASFITKEELERRRDRLLRDDCLAIRCDVGVTEVADAMPVGPNRRGHRRRRSPSPWSRSRSLSPSYSSESDDNVPLLCKRGGQQQPLDDKEYIRRCLTAKRRRQ